MAANPPIIAPPAVPLAEARTFLRLRSSADDDVVSAIVGAATAMCEQFTRAAIIARDITEYLPITGDWQRLGHAPVRAIAAVTGIDAGGGESALAAGAHSSEIDAGGSGRVRVHAPGAAVRMRIAYNAGLVGDVGEVPDAIRQGIMILAGHLLRARDAEDPGDPPAAVAALWQPWRRVRIA